MVLNKGGTELSQAIIDNWSSLANAGSTNPSKKDVTNSIVNSELSCLSENGPNNPVHPWPSLLQRRGGETNQECQEVVDLYFAAVINIKEYKKSGIYAQNYIVDLS